LARSAEQSNESIECSTHDGIPFARYSYRYNVPVEEEGHDEKARETRFILVNAWYRRSWPNSKKASNECGGPWMEMHDMPGDPVEDEADMKERILKNSNKKMNYNILQHVM
jgi:hypothetical protein